MRLLESQTVGDAVPNMKNHAWNAMGPVATGSHQSGESLATGAPSHTSLLSNMHTSNQAAKTMFFRGLHKCIAKSRSSV